MRVHGVILIRSWVDHSKERGLLRTEYFEIKILTNFNGYTLHSVWFYIDKLLVITKNNKNNINININIVYI